MKKYVLLLLVSMIFFVSCDKKCTEHDFVQTSIIESTCANEGEKIYTCSKCGKIKEVSLEKKKHTYENDICVNCGNRKVMAYFIYFIVDEHVKVVVYDTLDDAKNGKNGQECSYAYSKDKEQGLVLQNGTGDCVFKLVFEEGYIISSFKVKSSDCVSKINTPNDTKEQNLYVLDNISSDITVTITSKEK